VILKVNPIVGVQFKWLNSVLTFKLVPLLVAVS